jgi:hypothetical protein
MSRLDFPPDDDRPLDPGWWAPLGAVGRMIAGEPRFRFFDLGDFMVMARVVRRPRRPDVLLYKHCYTRRYLNLDHAGHAYRYGPTREFERGTDRYVRHHHLRTALDDLDLWELPWMKPSLDEHRHGLSWEDRWRLHPDADEREKHRRPSAPSRTAAVADLVGEM